MKSGGLSMHLAILRNCENTESQKIDVGYSCASRAWEQ